MPLEGDTLDKGSPAIQTGDPNGGM